MVCSSWRWGFFGGLQRALLVLMLAAGLAPAAHAERVALLVGNASYSNAPLRNPPNDVREMEAALTAVGFKVSKVLNADQSQLKRAVRDFGNSARGAEMALLYYSGHGTQVRGENYLIPVGASIEKESDYEIEALSTNAVLAQLREAQPRAAVVVLDACRDNPHLASTKTLTKGLARMDAPTGTMIAFATAPNDVAQDNGLYARVLARNIQRPGLELLDVFRDTASEVRRQTSGKQIPRVSEVSIDQRIYLAGRGSSPPVGEQGLASQVASVFPEQTQLSTLPAANASSVSNATKPSEVQRTPEEDLQFEWPAKGELIALFDEAKSKGIAISGNQGAPIWAAADGRVVYAGDGLRGYGNLVIVRHNKTFMTAYAHTRNILVQEDQEIKKGQKIAEMGTSDTNQVKVHFELRLNGKPIDPLPYLSASGSSLGMSGSEDDPQSKWLSMVRKPGFLQSQAGMPGYYMVRPGDTIFRIALEAGQSWRSIVNWNGLSGPNVLEVGMVLRVVPPNID